MDMDFSSSILVYTVLRYYLVRLLMKGKPNMHHVFRISIIVETFMVGLTPCWSLADDTKLQQPVIRKGITGIKLRERGSLLVEAFKGDEVDKQKWRLWHSDPTAVHFSIQNGQFVISGKNHLQHNGLWSLNPAKYKDVTLVGRMNVHTEGPHPHELLLHLCGGDIPHSPDHWVEIAMKDISGNKAQFRVYAAVEQGAFKQSVNELTLDRGNDTGFMARISLDGSRNLCTTEVQDRHGKWHELVKPIPLYLRTTHCEIKMRGGPEKNQAAQTKSRGWFKNVRIYPRAVSHPVLVHLVRRDGSPIFFRENGSWPPKVRIGDRPPQSIVDLVVELWTADGKTRISRVQSPNLASYMLPLDHTDWDVFPVGALVRISCNGKSLGEAKIPVKGLQGLYPNDVYDIFLE